MRTSLKRKFFTIMSGIVFAVVLFIGMPAVSRAYQPTVGIVSAAAAKVRKEPSTSSDVVGSLLKGSSVTITDEVTDSAGSMWYKVTVENSTGYIRSDLLIKATVSTPNTQTQTVNLTTTGSQPAATSVTKIAETKAYVNYKSVVVRQGASTDHEIMGSVVENTPVIITGEAKASHGRKWYQFRYTNQSGREVVGFVRADLLTVGDPPAAAQAPAEAPAESSEAAPAEGESGETPEGEEAPAESSEEAPAEAPVEEPAPQEPAVKPDYEMVFTQNDEGVEEWFLYDNINGTRQALSNLQAAAAAGASIGENDSEDLSTQKIIIIVLAVVAAILAVTVVLLLFKIKDLYSDDDYDDDDDDEEDEDEEDEDDEDEEEEAVEEKKPKKRTIADNLKAVNNAGSAKIAKEKEKGNIAIKNVEYIPEEEPFEPGKSVVSKPQSKRKAKNFLIDDDEFEFEFLNMDDRN